MNKYLTLAVLVLLMVAETAYFDHRVLPSSIAEIVIELVLAVAFATVLLKTA